MLAPWPRTENTIRGKVVASPESRPWWVLWVHVCPWLVRAPKVYDSTLNNLLFGLCEKLNYLSLILVTSQSSNTPLYPKVLLTKECAPTISPFVVFTFGLEVESIKELGVVSLYVGAINTIPAWQWKVHIVYGRKMQYTHCDFNLYYIW